MRLVVSGFLIGAFALASLLAPLIAPFDPTEQRYESMLAPPRLPHVLGTDEFGRDILSRLLWGGRASLAVASGAVAVAIGIGVPTGIVAGFYGGFLDLVLMRMVDLLLVFPPIVLAIAATSLFGKGLGPLTLVIGFIYSPRFARLMHASTQSVRSRSFVEASRAAGASDARILYSHIVPSILSSLLVQTSLTIGFGVLLESGLSFLGLGVRPPMPSWGLMIGEARNVMTRSPLYILWPSAAIMCFTLAVNMLGDCLRDRLDPRLANG